MGNGELIRFWEDRWVPELDGDKLNSQPPPNCNWTKASDFIDQASHSWNLDKLKSCVSEEKVQAISKIPISLSIGQDKIIWKPNKSGKNSVKSGYHQIIGKVSASKPS